MAGVQDIEDAVIVGAGPIGLACAISAKRRGLEPLVIDAGALVNSIVHYPIGMTFFTTPDLLEIGGHPFACAGAKPTREEALKYYRGVARAEGLRVRPYTRLVGAAAVGGDVRCDVESVAGASRMRCRRLVLATGYYDHFNPLGVPGEDLPHVSHRFDEGHRSYGLDVVVIGGKNSAIEAALELYRAGARVTLVYRQGAFKPTVKYWLKPDIENRLKAGEIKARLGAEVLRIEPGHVVVRLADGREERLAADRVFALTGYHPDFDLFRKIGIALEPQTDRPRCNPETLETSVPGVYMAGSITAGRATSEVFIENGRFDGERIFGDAGAKPAAPAGVGGKG
ncbi:MAG TPA: YpdA family putative bacillithiol disulfide reductase [Deltaproteobacteria bacterium]|jgi:thioredoxin reductase (NADPH)|nr:YpdA family putative bacillithiol disulfide reductase [Deltaproteobacteria bacterium]